MDLPLGQSDMFFQQLNTHRYSPVTADTVLAIFFWRRRVRTDQRWDEDFGAGGGQNILSKQIESKHNICFHQSENREIWDYGLGEWTNNSEFENGILRF
jgi:predicted 2-oxoglutarate/Fe(II)-dependent dioxygenase YbiX